MSLSRFVPVVTFLTLASACGTDKPTSPASTNSTALTAAEFNSMVDALTAVNAFGFGRTAVALDATVPVRVARVLAAQTTQTLTIDQTQACPGGGTAHIDGTATQNFTSAQSGTITMYVHLTFNGCKVTAPDGQEFTFEGNPTLNMAVDATFSPGTMTMQGHDSGGFRWSTNGKTGTCPFNVLVSITGSGSSSTGRATGDICGTSIDRTF
jgi:hypothetical protein